MCVGVQTFGVASTRYLHNMVDCYKMTSVSVCQLLSTNTRVDNSFNSNAPRDVGATTNYVFAATSLFTIEYRHIKRMLEALPNEMGRFLRQKTIFVVHAGGGASCHCVHV